jgi:hypothetical protein
LALQPDDHRSSSKEIPFAAVDKSELEQQLGANLFVNANRLEDLPTQN